MKSTILGVKLLIIQIVDKKKLRNESKYLIEETEIMKILDRMNINQLIKIIAGGLVKEKIFCLISHHSYRKSFEDSSWLEVEREAIK
jgi:hypothetical protein